MLTSALSVVEGIVGKCGVNLIKQLLSLATSPPFRNISQMCDDIQKEVAFNLALLSRYYGSFSQYPYFNIV